MKGYFLYLPLFALALLTACGCDEKGQGITFAKATTERCVSLTKDNNSPKCQINLSINYAKTGNADIDNTINNAIELELFDMENISMEAAIDSFANQYTTDYTESLTSLYRTDRTDESKRSWYEYKYTIKTETEDGRKGITVLKADINYYEGGAHGISLFTTMNFDNSTGKRLTLKDVFVKGSDKRLNETLLKSLEEKTRKKGLDELQADGYLCTTDIYAPQNFVLGKSDITFIYNAYEIAPYERGRTELAIGYDELEDILVKELKN